MTPKEFFNPRYSTAEMENSKIRNGNFNYQKVHMFFDDKKEGLPTRTIGRVWKTGEKSELVTWNQFGECWMNNARFRECDMIRPNQPEIEMARALCATLTLLLICFVFSILF